MNRLIVFLFCIKMSGAFAQGDAILDRLTTVHSYYDDRGRLVGTDVNHNIYHLGSFGDIADFDPGPGVYNMSTGGGANSYLLKLDPAGNLIWAKQWGSSSTISSLTDIIIDTNENIYISGHWSGSSFDFDPGPGQVVLSTSSSSQARAFLLKLDSNGDYLWLRTIAPSVTNGDCHGNALAVDTAGYIYITGGFSQSSVNASNGVGTTNSPYVQLTSSAGCPPVMSDYVIKYNSNGTIIWTKVVDVCGGVDGAFDMVASPAGDIYIVSDFTGLAEIETETDTLSLDAGYSSDPYVMKLASGNGDLIWFKQFWSKDAVGNNARGSGITVDDNDNVYFMGTFRDSIDMDPGSGTFYKAPVNFDNYDVFLCKLNGNGDFLWVNQIGGTGNEDVDKGIDVDSESNVYMAGMFYNTVDFSGQTLISSGLRDVFFLKADQDGNYLWVKRIGGAFNDQVEGLILDQEEHITLSGSFSGTVDLDPGVPVKNMTASNYDGFHLRLKQCMPSTGVFTHTSCGPYYWYGTNYTSNNNTATHTLTNAAGCDSIVTLNLTVKTIPQGVFSHTSCEPYQWIDGITYASSNNTAAYTITNGGANGCDSVVHLNLTVININNTLSFNNGVLTANQNGASYQWLDCDNGNTPISGATSQLLTLSQNGSYAVEITKDGCTKLSGCFEMTNLGIQSTNNEIEIFIHPNPASNLITVSNVPIGSHLVLTDLTGKIIESQIVSTEETIINTSSLSNGVYFVNISNYSTVISDKFIIQK